MVARLFPIVGVKLLNKRQIEALNNSLTMKDESGTIPAGYTYFSQLIAHDIADSTSFPDRDAKPTLNLQSIYGDKAFRNSTARPIKMDGTFRINLNGYDVIRDYQGVPHIPEPRNDNNAVLIQMHLLWQKIHNEILNRYHTNANSPYHAAQADTLLLYQHLVANDLMKRLLHNDVYQYYFEQWQPGILSMTMPIQNVPIEFSLAAFRFGHSMIRSKYLLNTKSKSCGPAKLITRKLAKLIRGDGAGHLNKHHKIAWKHFFGKSAKPSNQIDIRIANPLANTIVSQQLSKINSNSKGLVKINLSAGQNLSLANSVDILDWIEVHHKGLYEALELYQSRRLFINGATDLEDANNTLSPLFDTDSEGHQWIVNLPLWLFILSESQQSTPFGYCGLGRLGSLIVAEVIRNALISACPLLLDAVTNGLEQPFDFISHADTDLSSNLKQHASGGRIDFSVLLKALGLEK